MICQLLIRVSVCCITLLINNINCYLEKNMTNSYNGRINIVFHCTAFGRFCLRVEEVEL